MDIDIIIVNWNSKKHLEVCLRSIEKNISEFIQRIYVIDNGSDCDLCSNIKKLFPGLPVDTVINENNVGFSRACNQGARLGSACYLLFLNPDAGLFENSILAPLQFLESEKNLDVGICGVQLVDEAGDVSRTCSRFPTLGRLAAQALGLNKLPGLQNTGLHMTDWDHGQTAEVDQVIGAFFLIRRNLFESLGGFDQRFFVYFEEVDLSFRARSLGYKSVYLADAQAFHAGGGTSSQVKDVRLFYSLRSRLLYGFKHFPSWQAWLLAGVTMMVEPVSRILYCAASRNWAGVKQTLQGYRLLWRDVPHIIASHKQRSAQ